jgi:hypothetical protein
MEKKFVNFSVIKIYTMAFCILIFSAPFANLHAQNKGSIVGRIIDAVTGEPMIGVNVFIPELKIAAASDVNGRYLLQNVPGGSHTVVYQMMGYAKSSAVIVLPEGGRTTCNISMSYSSAKEVVVSAKKVSNTTASLLRQRKKAVVAQDSISSEQIAKSSDSDASDAAKRVTGITMDKDERVIIRGLSERYSSTMFSNSIIPSPDPDRRIVPLDIFPVGLLDNLTIIKAYMPDMPGEFCGGVVQINPRDYPEKLQYKLSFGLGMNLDTVGKAFWNHDGGKYDWFGIDDGTRDLPSDLKKYGMNNLGMNLFPSTIKQKIGISMKNNYTPHQEKGAPGGKISFEAGDSFTLKEKYNIGFIVSGLYSSGLKNKKINMVEIDQTFNPQRIYAGDESTLKIMKGALISLGFTSDNHKIRNTTFYSQKTDKDTKVIKGYNSDRQLTTNDVILKNHELIFAMSDILFIQTSGEHHFKPLNLTVNWTGSYSRASRNEPDTRHIQLVDPVFSSAPGIYELYRPEDIKRFWLDHTDRTGDFSGSMTYKFKQWQGIYSKITAGGGFNDRKRKSSKRSFQWMGNGVNGTQYAFEPLEWFFGWPFIVGSSAEVTDRYHYYLYETTSANDKYTGTLRINHGFCMLDFPVVKQLRIAGGFRYENSKMNLRAWNPTYAVNMDLRSNPLKEHNYLYGIGLTYSIIDSLNLRLAYSKNIARPDFREVVEFKYELLSENATVIGNKYLKQTDIHNYDARLEWFPSDSEIVSGSFFYKYLIRPIEMLEVDSATGNDLYTYRNNSFARNYGFEIEFRKNMALAGSKEVKNHLKNFILFANASWIFSKIKLKYTKYIEPDDIDLLSLPTVSELYNPTLYTSQNRPLQGQSPWIINAGFEYMNKKIGHSTSLLFNMYGRRIVRVGTRKSTVIPWGDVYEEAHPKLDLVIRQKILKYGEFKLTFENLIDPEIKEMQKITHESLLFSRDISRKTYRNGRSIGVSYTYSL